MRISKMILRSLMAEYDLSSSVDIASIARRLLTKKNIFHIVFKNIQYLFIHLSQKSTDKRAEILVVQI